MVTRTGRGPACAAGRPRAARRVLLVVPAAAVTAVVLAGCAGSGEVNTIATTPSSIIVAAPTTSAPVITAPSPTTVAAPPAAPVTTLQAAVVTASTTAAVAPRPGSTATTRAPSGASAGTYTVKAGDSLFGIARANGVRLNDLLAVNGFTAESPIRPGDVVKLPAGATLSGGAPAAPSTTVASTATTAVSSTPTTVVAAGTSTYTVKAGDSLYGISQRTGVRLADLLRVNGLTESSAIRPGDVLKLPRGAVTQPATGTTVKGTPTPSGQSYEVKAGDTLFGIAQRFGVKLNDLLAVNGFTASSVITPGTRIKIPAR